jgi:GxxExxY protein
MHPLYERASGLTETVISAALEVHRDKGPGLLESICEWCLIKELELRGLRCSNQQLVRLEYKGFSREETLRFDLLVEDCLLIETKAVQEILPIHKAQLLSYMKLLNVPFGSADQFQCRTSDRRNCPTDASRRESMKGNARNLNRRQQREQRKSEERVFNQIFTDLTLSYSVISVSSCSSL